MIASFISFLAGAEDHLAEREERRIAPRVVEHVLCAEEADAFGAEPEGLGRALGVVGVGANTKPAPPIDEAHEP